MSYFVGSQSISSCQHVGEIVHNSGVLAREEIVAKLRCLSLIWGKREGGVMYRRERGRGDVKGEGQKELQLSYLDYIPL